MLGGGGLLPLLVTDLGQVAAVDDADGAGGAVYSPALTDFVIATRQQKLRSAPMALEPITM